MKKRFSIPNMKVALFQSKVDKMSRKAVKLGISPFKVEYHDEYVVSVKSTTIENHTHHIRYVNVTVEGEAPQIEGFKAIAMLERLENQNIVKRFDVGSESEISFEELAYRSTKCDHCNSNRARKYILVLQNTESKELIQVGKSCLKDYTGSNYSAEQIAKYYEDIDMVHELEHVSEDEIMGSGNHLSLFNIDEILAISIEFTEESGYKPSSFHLSTKDETNNFIFKKNLAPYRDMPTANELIDKHAEKIQLVKEFFTKNEATNDYTHNLKLILSSELIEHKQIGYAVSAYSSYRKAMGRLDSSWKEDKRKREAEMAQREVERQANLLSEYVGEIGQRKEFELIADRVITYEGAYGVGYMYFFKDKKENVFLWSTNKYIDLEENQKLSIVGTIKDHKEYRDIKQTIVTRCKIK